MTKRVGFVELDTVRRRARGAADPFPVTGRPQAHVRAAGVRFADLCAREAWTADAVLEAALRLQDVHGVDIVIGNCGYMAQHQRYVADRLRVPFVSSSLTLYPSLVQRYGADGVGIIVASKHDLHPDILAPVGIPALPDRLVAGMEAQPHFFDVIHLLQTFIDHDRIRAETLTAGFRLVEEGARALLVECTLLPPHSRALAETVGVPVFDLTDCFPEVTR